MPYGRSEIPVRVPEERLVDIVKPDNVTPLPSATSRTAELIASNQKFLSVARTATRVCIALGSCGTRELSTNLTKAVLQSTTSPQTSATVVCTEESIEPDASSIGASRILRHTSKTETKACTPLSNGFTPEVNLAFAEADLRVLIGELRPHQLLGYAGLCDLVFPYLGSEASIRVHEGERSGLSAEGLHKERLEIARSFNNTFALGIVLDAELRPSSIAFDSLEGCFASLEPIVSDVFSKQVAKKAEIVIMSAGGSPFDSTLDRSVEALPASLAILKKDGALVVAAECEQGHGGKEFYGWSAEHKESRYLESRLRHHFSYKGLKASLLARALQSHRVYLVSTIPDHYVESVFNMRPAPTVNAALQSAQRVHGADSRISVIPNGQRVIPRFLEAPPQQQ